MRRPEFEPGPHQALRTEAVRRIRDQRPPANGTNPVRLPQSFFNPFADGEVARGDAGDGRVWLGAERSGPVAGRRHRLASTLNR